MTAKGKRPFLSHLHKFLFQRGLLPVIDVHGPAVVVLKRSADRHVVKAVQVQVRHGRDGGAEAGAARLVFNPAAVRVGSAAGLVDWLQGELVLKLAVLAREERTNGGLVPLGGLRTRMPEALPA